MHEQPSQARAKVTLGLSLFLSGCLPDPRPYDPCVDSQSYYSVPPQGCNGHELVVLSEQLGDSSEGVDHTAKSTVTQDADYVYWVGPTGSVFRTPKAGGRTDLWLSATRPYSVSLANTETTLYALVMADYLGAAGSTVVVAIDKSTQQTTRIARTATQSGVQFAVQDGRFYANTASPTACIISGSLATNEAGENPPTCVVTGFALAFNVNEKGVFFVASEAYSTNLFFQPHGTSTREPIATGFAYAFDLELHDGLPYWTECPQNGPMCVRARINAQGTRETLVDDLGWAQTTHSDGEHTFAVTQRNSNFIASQLYAWEVPGLSPTLLAASLDMTLDFVIDTQYLYATVLDYNDDGVERVRLVRIKR